MLPAAPGGVSCEVTCPAESLVTARVELPPVPETCLCGLPWGSTGAVAPQARVVDTPRNTSGTRIPETHVESLATSAFNMSQRLRGLTLSGPALLTSWNSKVVPRFAHRIPIRELHPFLVAANARHEHTIAFFYREHCTHSLMRAPLFAAVQPFVANVNYLWVDVGAPSNILDWRRYELTHTPTIIVFRNSSVMHTFPDPTTTEFGSLLFFIMKLTGVSDAMDGHMDPSFSCPIPDHTHPIWKPLHRSVQEFQDAMGLRDTQAEELMLGDLQTFIDLGLQLATRDSRLDLVLRYLAILDQVRVWEDEHSFDDAALYVSRYCSGGTSAMLAALAVVLAMLVTRYTADPVEEHHRRQRRRARRAMMARLGRIPPLLLQNPGLAPAGPVAVIALVVVAASFVAPTTASSPSIGNNNNSKDGTKNKKELSWIPTSDTCRPTYFVMGARKGGSTSLYHYLNAHPNIKPYSMSRRKTAPSYGEVHFLHKAHYSLQQYNNKFPHLKPGEITGESSVSTLVSYAAPNHTMHFCGPKVKFLAILREPVARMHSQYLMRIRLGSRLKPTVPFRTWAIKELQRFEQRVIASPNWIDGFEVKAPLFGPSGNGLYEGLYSVHLRHWFKRYPRDQFLLFIYDHFFKHPSGHLKEAYRFLGMDDSVVRCRKVVQRRFNTASDNVRVNFTESHIHQVDAHTDAHLKKFFEPYNRDLEALLNITLPSSWFALDETALHPDGLQPFDPNKQDDDDDYEDDDDDSLKQIQAPTSDDDDDDNNVGGGDDDYDDDAADDDDASSRGLVRGPGDVDDDDDDGGA
ncbi:hypothetical protein PTSG_06151 [Salpingoeca rosetta]|uniref:Sulfotransferase domain-containing protein n=1 Tax=Salpingoeca rosetta (strain ATCC 50818 / BSB-021) TaxID=946362 RepID=F2UC35_SALR5|nr:uncharacterized protein PTSG_06151 [Salpingoeca rosetta]EGD74142.1 hypothetical protein PTSG_06151 [Salpingoeca rosetta]|eukprot:XP_004993043.1 hypothetical protein PTSG_06151 [Salpingoeca rosetta]